MRARTEALIGAATLLVVVAFAAALGARRNTTSIDPRASVFLAGPEGARGLAESLEKLGLVVRRFRRSLRQLDHEQAEGDSAILVLLNPSMSVDGVEIEQIRAWHDQTGGGLLLAGEGAAAVMRCYGYALDWRGFDSVAVASRPGEGGSWPRSSGVLAVVSDTIVADSSRQDDVGLTGCVVPPVSRVDTLLVSVTGRVVMLRLHRADAGGEVILAADAAFFRNRALRESPAGPFVLALFAERYRRVIFDEAHHGFEEGGSLAAATLEWTRRSPWGWAMWQAAVVGVVALLAGAFRFGPVRRVIERRRRSPAEHVRALATALAAARGHDVAIETMVAGLRRRLSPATPRPGGSSQEWLESLGRNVRGERALSAVQTLKSLVRPGQSPEGVLQAALAVEDVWEELRP